MNIWVLGANGSGKTPFAKMVSEALNIPLISVSDWLSPFIKGTILLTKQDQIDKTSEIAVREMIKDPDCIINWVRSRLAKPSIIEGIRSPYEFTKLANLREDVVIFLNRENNPYRTNELEAGLLVINAYVHWAANIGLLDKEKRISYSYQMEEVSDAAADFIKIFKWRGWCLECGGIGCEHQN